MTELAECKALLDLLVETAKSTSTTLILNTMYQYLSIYHSKRDDKSLIQMNYCVLILLIKQGLFDIESAKRDMSVVIKQHELLELIKTFKS